MFKQLRLTVAISALIALPAAHAGVDLIAVDGLSASQSDLSAETAAPLENGVAGNLLGGLGSGIAYAGNGIFLALPDRGPNAVSYNAAVDDTTSYIDRFHTIRMTLAKSAPGSSLPFALTPVLTATTLLHTSDKLVYGDGVSAGLADGAPALNATNATHYFTGRSDNFNPAHLSTQPLDARMDPESIRVSNDGQSIFVSDEYGPYVYRFDRATGLRTGKWTLPAKFAVTNLSAVGNDEIADNTAGRVANKGMEGLAITPDGKFLVGAMQSPLIQDGATAAACTRLVKIDLTTGLIKEYAYPLTNIGTASKPKYPTVSDIVAVNDHAFLVDERDGKGFGDGSTAAFKMVYKIDLNGATPVGKVTGEAQLAPFAVAKTPFLDIVATLGSHGIAATEIPAKLEGLAFGPDVVIAGVKKHTLFVANDNDFIPTVTDSLHPSGAANPNEFFVFAFGYNDLPGYQAQQLTP
ncbi:MAG TPA: esterase-like activity of phytase family protein [Xanthomonadaceae bacterium]